jgi:ketosteroid isomerase-like protein
MNRGFRGWLLVGLLCSFAAAAAGSGFDATLDAHLQAIRDRDLPALLDTVSDRADFSVIFPDGARLVGKQAYESMHREWFADPDWRMSFHEVSRWQRENMAGVLLRYEYQDTPEPGTGNPRQRYLFLLFERIEDRWLLVHDQNTPIETPTSP